MKQSIKKEVLGQANFHRTFKSILWHPFASSANYFHKIDLEFLVQLLSIRTSFFILLFHL